MKPCLNNNKKNDNTIRLGVYNIQQRPAEDGLLTELLYCGINTAMSTENGYLLTVFKYYVFILQLLCCVLSLHVTELGWPAHPQTRSLRVVF